MKKILLAFSTLLVATQFVSAQCTPDSQFTSPGFYPDSATGIPDACVDAFYDQVITVVGISDTVVGGFTVSVDSITIDNVSGLPATLSYACENASCVIYPAVDPSSCIQISGTPVAGDVGPYTMVIEYTAYVTVFGTPTPVPLTEDYTLDVVTCSVSLMEQTMSEKTLLKITDMMGRETLPTANIPLIYYYSDGSIERIVQVK